MAVKTKGWISAWLLLTAPFIIWDATYCFYRPRSMKGGDMHWIWKMYELFGNVDHMYGFPAYNAGSGFPNAQSMLNIVETLLNMLYLYVAHIAQWPAANLIAFTSANLTLSKTVLYMAQEYYCGYCNVGHNDFETLLFVWIIPMGLWIVFPAAIVYTLGKQIAQQLTVAQAFQEKEKAK